MKWWDHMWNGLSADGEVISLHSSTVPSGCDLEEMIRSARQAILLLAEEMEEPASGIGAGDDG